MGNRLSTTTSLPSATAYGGLTSYQYDTKNQLTQEQSQKAGGYTNLFGYDAAGNATTFRGASQTFNSDNQLTGTGFTFDGNGNPSTYRGTSLTWDAQNRLTSVGSLLTAGYTADGLRAWKQGSGGKTYYLYDGSLPVCELSSSGNVQATTTFGVTGLLTRHTSGASSTFYTFDPQGNPVLTLDNSGVAQSAAAFDAFGSKSGTASSDPYSGFGSQWGYVSDAETGLSLLGLRYYDSATGRFLNRDPIGQAGGLNVYAYCRNNPVSRADPSGLCDIYTQFSGLGFQTSVYDYLQGLSIGSNAAVDGFSMHTFRNIHPIPAKAQASPYFETSDKLGQIGFLSAVGAAGVAGVGYGVAQARFALAYGQYMLMGGAGVAGTAASHPEEVQEALQELTGEAPFNPLLALDAHIEEFRWLHPDTNAVPYQGWYAYGVQGAPEPGGEWTIEAYPGIFSNAMNKAVDTGGTIHCYMEGFSENVYQQWVQKGGQLTPQNITNYEYHQVLNNETWNAITRFHR